MISKFLICSVCIDTLPCEILWGMWNAITFPKEFHTRLRELWFGSTDWLGWWGSRSRQTVKISEREQRNEKMRAVEWLQTSPHKWVMSTYETQGPVPVPKTVQTESLDRLHYCCRKKRLEHYQAFVKRNVWEQSPLDFTAGSLVCFRHCFRVNMQEMSLQSDDVFVRGRLYSLIGQLTQEVRAWRPVFATHYHRFTA